MLWMFSNFYSTVQAFRISRFCLLLETAFVMSYLFCLHLLFAMLSVLVYRGALFIATLTTLNCRRLAFYFFCFKKRDCGTASCVRHIPQYAEEVFRVEDLLNVPRIALFALTLSTLRIWSAPSERLIFITSGDRPSAIGRALSFASGALQVASLTVLYWGWLAFVFIIKTQAAA